jgi:transcriptional antiterminator RfaH
MITASFDTVHHPEIAWFCLRSKPKHEHITAAYLRQELGIEVYLPRVRFKRHTQVGPKWFNEALFPGYLFARFNLLNCLRQVHHGHGAQGIVHFGKHWPTVPDAVIRELRRTVPDERPCVLHEEFQPGTAVVIAGGPLHSLEAVVTRLMPGRMRAAVLLEFLGRQVMVEVKTEDLVGAGEGRLPFKCGMRSEE